MEYGVSGAVPVGGWAFEGACVVFLSANHTRAILSPEFGRSLWKACDKWQVQELEIFFWGLTGGDWEGFRESMLVKIKRRDGDEALPGTTVVVSGSSPFGEIHNRCGNNSGQYSPNQQFHKSSSDES